LRVFYRLAVAAVALTLSGFGAAKAQTPTPIGVSTGSAAGPTTGGPIPTTGGSTGTTGVTTGGTAGGTGTGHWEKVQLPDAETGYCTYTHTYRNGQTGTYPYPELGEWPKEVAGYLPIWINAGEKVELNLTGTVKFKYVWVDANGRRGEAAINPPPPKYLPLAISASAEAGAVGGCFVECELDNYFGDSERSYSDQDWISYNKDGNHLKIFNSSSGVVESSASLSASIEAIAPLSSWWSGGHVFVGIGLGSVIEDRRVDILANGYTNYRVKEVGPRPSLITLSDGSTVPITYNGADREPTPVYDSGPFTNTGLLHIGLPVREQTVIYGMMYDPNGGAVPTTTYIPTSIADAVVNYVGVATSRYTPTETFKWTSDSGSLSGSLPDGPSGYLLSDFSVSYNPPVKRKITSAILGVNGYPQTTLDDGAVGQGDSIQLDYQWADGLKASTMRTIKLHRASEPVQQTLSAVIDPNLASPYLVIPWASGEPWALPGDDDEDARVGSKPMDVKFASGTIVIPLLGVAGAALPEAAIPIAIISASLGLAAEFAQQPDSTPTVHRFAYQAGRDIIEGNNGVWTGNLGDYYWKVEARPRIHIIPEVTDKYGPNGFIGREVGTRRFPDGLTETPNKRLRLKYKDPAAGGAQP
jgi:hypothetical protein